MHRWRPSSHVRPLYCGDSLETAHRPATNRVLVIRTVLIECSLDQSPRLARVVGEEFVTQHLEDSPGIPTSRNGLSLSDWIAAL